MIELMKTGYKRKGEAGVVFIIKKATKKNAALKINVYNKLD